MTEFINKEQLIKEFEEDQPLVWNDDDSYELGRANQWYYDFNSIKAAHGIEQKTGSWVSADEQPYFRKHYHTLVCSECGKRRDGRWIWCPYCGSLNGER